MSLFDIFKRKKQEPKKAKPKKPAEKKGPLLNKVPTSLSKPIEPDKQKPVKKKERKQAPIKPVLEKKALGKGYRILSCPHVTEKATDLTEKNKYTFKIWSKSNKKEVKEAVEKTYGVNVKGIRMINVPKKKRRRGRQSGWKKGYKKAIVELKEGQKIEILPR